MTKHGLILVLHVVALCSCLFGLYRVFQNCSQYLSIIYTGLWFLTAGLANVAGILSIVFCYFDPSSNGLMTWSNYSLQYYYLLAWISCIVGYPAFVSSCWMHYTPSYFVHVFSISSLIPLLCWIFRKDTLLTITTQAVIVSAIGLMSNVDASFFPTAGQLYVTLLASNFYSSFGALFMFVNLVLFSVPQNHKLIGMAPKEAVTLSFTATTYFLAEGIFRMGLNERQVES